MAECNAESYIAVDDDLHHDECSLKDEDEVDLMNEAIYGGTCPDPHFKAQILLVTLLEIVCKQNQSEGFQTKNLFQKISDWLIKDDIIPKVFASDAYSFIRAEWEASLVKMMREAGEDSDDDCTNQKRHHTISALVQWERDQNGADRRSPILGPSGSRYATEFIQKERLGSGSFGCVYKAQHKLDKQDFAVKKIYTKKLSTDLWNGIQREVELLAALRHHHVVAYNSSWVEYQPCGGDISTGMSEAGPAVEIESEIDVMDSELEILFDSKASDIKFSAHDYQYREDRVVSKESTRLRLRTSSVTEEFVEETSSDSFEAVCEHVISNGEIRRQRRPPIRRALSYDGIEMMDQDKQAAVRGDFSNIILQGRVTVYIQMQLCHRTLKHWLIERNDQAALSRDVFSCISAPANRRIFREILLGIEYIHSKGVVHRDIKPGNIFLQGPCDEVKIGDFGLARSLLSEKTGLYTNSNLSSGLGTCLYAAPEQLQGRDYCFKSDMYSAGIVLYELFHPFVTESERRTVLESFRHSGIITTELLKKKAWQYEVAHILELTHRDPDQRPSAEQLIKSKTFQHRDEEKTRLRSQLRVKVKRIRRLEKTVMKMKLNPDHD